MKTGVEQIAEERQHQIDKHGFTGEHHAQHPEWYEERQLILAAGHLCFDDGFMNILFSKEGVLAPENWDKEWFERLCKRPYIERLKIAGALIAAEIDRLNALYTKKCDGNCGMNYCDENGCLDNKPKIEGSEDNCDYA